MLDQFLYALVHVFALQNIIYIFVGVAVGIVIGALPGLSVTLGVALMLPFTFGISPIAGILLLIGVYCAGTYGGSISAVLLKTPGTAASAATVEDGFALAQQGRANDALNISLYASVAGGIISGVALLFVAPQVAKFALKFGPPEFFALTLFGLTVIAGVSGKSMSKGMLMATLGMLLATVGQDSVTGVQRFIFNNNYLLTGIGIIPALIGLFAISEVLNQVEKRSKTIAVDTEVDTGKRFGWKNIIPFRRTIFRSSIIGIIIGAIPGTGGAISAFISYSEAKRKSKDPDSFGKGSMDGVAAAESGNNGTTGATLIPMLTLGIPGDVVTAVLLGALLVHGLSPGPQLFTNNGDIVYTVMIGFILVNIVMFFQAKLAIRWFRKVTLIPSSILFPIVMIICLVGAFTDTFTLYSVVLALAFGVIGYFFSKFDYPLPPLLIGFILGPIAETALRRSLILSDGSPAIFFGSPVALIFIILALVAFLLPIVQKRFARNQ